MGNSQSKKELARKIVAVIPSRYASTRFEGKPLANILGKPMIQWVCERVRACSALSDVIVATDDRRIADAVLRFGGKGGMSTLAFAIVEPNEIANPKDVKVVIDRNGYALYFSRSPIPCGRDPETLFTTYKHLGIYAYTRRFLDIFRYLPEGDLERIEKLEQL